MKNILIAVFIAAWSAQAVAAAGPSSCGAQAAEKKYAGAAKDSFLKKCTADAKAACESSAKDQKLAGAAKSSFLKKCTNDAK